MHINTAANDLTPSVVRRTFQGLFSLVFPDDCRICEQPLREISRIPVCRACLAKPEPLAAEYFCVECHAPFLNSFPLDAEGRCALCRRGVRGFDRAYSFGFYEGELRELIHLFKYGRIETLAKPLGRLLALALPRDQVYDAVVPMPLHWRKRWQRGFNQSALLARELGRRVNVPVKNALRRVRSTSAQAGLTNAKRRLNVSGAFRPKRAHSLDGKRVLLIDDVMTTGATAASCARALKLAGARQVTLLTVARADRRMHFDQPIPDSLNSGSFEDAQSRSIA
ncbi:MAG TPA: ComF family protein [Bryobacteraceae bacterium]|nr:ComF family protein [Bryobacteraceae bacterium]